MNVNFITSALSHVSSRHVPPVVHTQPSTPHTTHLDVTLSRPGAPVTMLSELLQRLLAFSARQEQYDALFPPPSGWQEPPAYALLMAQRSAAEAAAAAEGPPRPRSSVRGKRGLGMILAVAWALEIWACPCAVKYALLCGGFMWCCVWIGAYCRTCGEAWLRRQLGCNAGQKVPCCQW